MPNSKKSQSSYAAIFIDFENVYYFLKNHFVDPPELNNYVLDMLRGLREKLTAQGLDCLISYAYADFERLAVAPQGQLYLMGVCTRNVLGTAHKNAADMQMCIDLMEVMYTRPDIGTFIVVAGDRDYIPVLQHLKRSAKNVLVAGFRESVSGDLLQNIGADNFIDARDLLTSEQIGQLEARRIPKLTERVPVAPAATASVAHLGTKTHAIVAPRPLTRKPSVLTAMEELAATPPTGRLCREVERRALALIITKLSEYSRKRNAVINEMWLGPFMRLLTDELAELPDYERREVVNRMQAVGAISIEKREGDPHPFSVIVLNYNHPDVQALYPGDNA